MYQLMRTHYIRLASIASCDDNEYGNLDAMAINLLLLNVQL